MMDGSDGTGTSAAVEGHHGRWVRVDTSHRWLVRVPGRGWRRGRRERGVAARPRSRARSGGKGGGAARGPKDLFRDDDRRVLTEGWWRR